MKQGRFKDSRLYIVPLMFACMWCLGGIVSTPASRRHECIEGMHGINFISVDHRHGRDERRMNGGQSSAFGCVPAIATASLWLMMLPMLPRPKTTGKSAFR